MVARIKVYQPQELAKLGKVSLAVLLQVSAIVVVAVAVLEITQILLHKTILVAKAGQAYQITLLVQA